MSIFSRNNVKTENEVKPIVRIKGGEKVPCKLESYGFSIDKNGNKTKDFEFKFKGTDPDNNGIHIERVQASRFDKKDSFYSDEWAERWFNKFAHIMTAFITEDEFFSYDENSASFYDICEACIEKLDAIKKDKDGFVDIDLTLKIILNEKGFTTFPMFPDFISSDLTPSRILTTGNKINMKTGYPYDLYEMPAAPSNPNTPTAIDPAANEAEDNGFVESVATETENTEDDMPF